MEFHRVVWKGALNAVHCNPLSRDTTARPGAHSPIQPDCRCLQGHGIQGDPGQNLLSFLSAPESHVYLRKLSFPHWLTFSHKTLICPSAFPYQKARCIHSDHSAGYGMELYLGLRARFCFHTSFRAATGHINTDLALY